MIVSLPSYFATISQSFRAVFISRRIEISCDLLTHIFMPIVISKFNRKLKPMSDLEHILNWRRIDEKITTSGQPSETELAEIASIGVTTIINLGPHDNKGALADEPTTVANLEMIYVYIPVDFEAPSQSDFEEFKSALAQYKGQKIHVHCIYNARVSAFFYLYLQQVLGKSKNEAKDLLDGIWRPGGVWAEFIGDKENFNLPNRYLGYDY